MMRELIEFNNDKFGKLTVIEKDGEFFFIGKQVANMLGYKKSRNALRMHVDEDDALKQGVIDRLGRVQETITINESGLYSLILASRLPQAKEFKRWVTKEVLPSIRKNGGYIKNQENMTNEQLLANAILVANNVIAEKEKKILELEPKAQYYDEFVDKNLLTNFRNTAKELGVGQNTLIKFLLEKKLIYRDKRKRLMPYSSNNKGYFEIKEWKNDNNGVIGIQTLVTPKGRKYLMMLLYERIDDDR